MQKKKHPSIKQKLHPRNRHRQRYDFPSLIAACPALAPWVQENTYGDLSIDFANPKAVKTLNQALLIHHYQLSYWDIPDDYLCPPIPGRADYIHYLADLLAQNYKGKVPKGKRIQCLDIGVGANCIYPIIGHQEYGWQFIGADVHQTSIASAQQIIDTNSNLKAVIKLRHQENSKHIFKNIIQPNEWIDATICNPPFHSSAQAATKGTLRKLKHLKPQQKTKKTLNFGGQAHELWCEGGEIAFIKTMIQESRQFATACCWFTTLVSKQENLKPAYKALKAADAQQVETIPMGQGNKISRILAWSFLTSKQQAQWVNAKSL